MIDVFNVYYNCLPFFNLCYTSQLLLKANYNISPAIFVRNVLPIFFHIIYIYNKPSIIILVISYSNFENKLNV